MGWTVLQNIQKFYYHHDHQGSIVAMSDEKRNVVQNYIYDARGNVIASEMNHWYDLKLPRNKAGIQDNKLYNERKSVLLLGLYYYRHRYYNPTQGRFLNKDPLLYVDGPNAYAYVGNNPVNWVDPWGLYYIDPMIKHKIEEGFYGFANGTKRYINQSKESISNIAQETKKLAIQARNTSNNFVSDVNEGCIKGDYAQNTNAGTLVGQVICGEIPILGTAADARDLKASIDNCNGITFGCAGNVSLNTIGFIPVLGSVKNFKHVDAAGELVKGSVLVNLRKNSKKISHKIVHGHAEQHRKEFESIGITTPKQLEKHVRNVIHNPSHFRKLKNDRIMFIDDKTQTVVAYDPHRRDFGSTYIHDPSVTTEKNALKYLLNKK